jgi:hypothetical protein
MIMISLFIDGISWTVIAAPTRPFYAAMLPLKPIP